MDRLALVSKILLDSRVIELRKENEALKLKLFWKDHDESDLKDLMRQTNNCGKNPPQCSCHACCVAGRVYADGPGMECTFKPWFEAHIASCGMEIGVGVGRDQEPVEVSFSEQVHYDIDAHFHSMGRDDWVQWTYGARLWKAASVSDPEIVKLIRLFDALKAEYGDD